MKVPFYKCNGNGNSFLIIVNYDLNKNFFLPESKIKHICHSIDYNIVDGLIIVTIKNDKILMDYFNNDGSWESLCLNGLRCVALLLSKELDVSNINIICNKELYNTKVIKNNYIEVKLNKPIYKRKNIIVENYKGNYINSGAKHLVIEKTDEWQENNMLYELSKKIRFNNIFFPHGINVNYYKIINKDTIEVKTYEKGIESMMESCASGSYACAYDYCVQHQVDGQIYVLNDGGDFKIIFNKNLDNNLLIGKAEIEYKKMLEIKNG